MGHQCIVHGAWDRCLQAAHARQRGCLPGRPTTTASANCAQRHLGIWIDLTQTDIDNWDDPAYAANVSRPYDLGGVANLSTTTVCPKFVTDPVTLQEIDSGYAVIAGSFPQQSANDLAIAINQASHS